MSAPDALGLLAIGAMALVTIVLRAGGFSAMGRVPLTPRIRRMLEALPGAVVAAAVLPIAAKGGPAVALAILAALLAMMAGRNELVAMLIGMMTAAGARSAGL